MKRIGTLKGIPIVEGNSNELKKNNILCNKKDGNIELSKRENGQVSNISGSSGGGGDRGNYIYCIAKTFTTIFISYGSLISILKPYLIYRDNFYIYYKNILDGLSDEAEIILLYVKLELPLKLCDTGGFRNITTLEEFEQLNGLDSNNRPFKIITEEEFYKDLTEEEARKIASEL